MDKEQLLAGSDVFCMAPWCHLHVIPVGQVFPCCMSAHLEKEAIGHLRNGDTLTSSWNSEEMRALRARMLGGVRSKMCERCYQQEELGQDSFRLAVNRKFEHHFGVVEETGADGTVENLNLPYIDIRFSNLCNYRCRICAPSLSSNWRKDGISLGWVNSDLPKVITATDDPDALWSELEPFMPFLEQIQFAGGEPLLMDEHYRIMNSLIEHERFDCMVTYNSNLSVLDYKGHDVPGMWSRFENVLVMASLDGMGARGDYMRKGQKWENIVANRERMLRECPNVHFRLAPTISIMNVFHLPDFYRDWVENELIEPDEFATNILFDPLYYNIRGLPEEAKATVDELYRAFMDDFVSGLGERGDAVRVQFEAVLQYMHGDNLDVLPQLRRVTRALDSLRDEKFEETFPELSDWIRSAPSGA